MNFETNKWYMQELEAEGFTEYQGTSPIDSNTLSEEEIFSQSFLNKVIESFSNN